MKIKKALISKILIFTVFVSFMIPNIKDTNAFDSNLVTIIYKSNGGTYTADITDSLNSGDRLAGKNLDDSVVRTKTGNIDVTGTSYRPSGMFSRFMGWNTEADGTGTWYRGGYTINEQTPNTLTLYAQWFNVLTWSAGLDTTQIKPSIKLNGSSEYLSQESALVINNPSELVISGNIDLSNMRSFMSLIWTRIDEVNQNSSGYVISKLDGRLSFDNEVTLTLESYFLEPAVPHTSLGNGKYEFKIDPTDTTYVYKNGDDELEVKIPVTLISKSDIYYNISFEEFMKPLSLEFSGDSITSESFNAIAESENSLIAISGGISMSISMSNIPVTFNNNSEIQWANFIKETHNYDLKITDTFKDDDGIIVIDNSYELNLLVDGETITAEQLSEVTWELEVIGGFTGNTETYISQSEAEITMLKSGIVKITATYENATTSIILIKSGDINRDGAVNGVDATLVQRYNASQNTEDLRIVDEYTNHLVDINQDGVINGVDVTLIQRMMAR